MSLFKPLFVFRHLHVQWSKFDGNLSCDPTKNGRELKAMQTF